jgi:hypothetical protein
MNPISLLVAVALSVVPAPRADVDIDADTKAALVNLESPLLNAQVYSAMALPYKYGVTQMPCKAKDMQPKRGWRPAREPSGKIQWVPGPVASARWAGIYGICFITSPLGRDKTNLVQRTALECECDGWLPAR